MHRKEKENMHREENRRNLNTENIRPVYTRKLPPGRELTGTAPGQYCADGTFVPWDSLSPVTEERTDASGRSIRRLVSVSVPGSGGTLVIPQDIGTVGRFVFKSGSPETVILPQGLSEISDWAFAYCTAVSVIFPPSLERIGTSAFLGSRIRAAVFPEHFARAGSLSFGSTENLGFAVMISGKAESGSGVFTQSGICAFTGRVSGGGEMFCMCGRLVSAVLTSGTRLPAGTFSCCGDLRSAVLPDGLRSVGESAFAGCARLLSVAYSGKKCSAGENAFRDTPVRENGTLPEQFCAE